MEKFKVKVLQVNIGNYEVDSITVNLNGIKTEICFDKADNVKQYDGKEINLIKDNGTYRIEKISFIPNEK